MQHSNRKVESKLAVGGKLGREIDVSVEEVHKRDNRSCKYLGDRKEYGHAERKR